MSKEPNEVHPREPRGVVAPVVRKGICLWQVVEAARTTGGNADKAAQRLGFRPRELRAIVELAKDQPQEIEKLIAKEIEAQIDDYRAASS